jgi:hypothetical protein
VHPPTNNKLTYRYFGDHIAGSVPSTIHSVKFIFGFSVFHCYIGMPLIFPLFFLLYDYIATDEKVTVLESEKRAWESSPEAQAMREALNPWRKHDEQQKK